MATEYDLSLSVMMRFGAKPCFLSSFRSNRPADRAQRRRWTRKSSTSPSSSTARHSQYFRSLISITISSRCQRGARSRTAASKIGGDQTSELQKPAADRLIRNVDATLSQQFLDIAKRQREPGIQPDCVLDDYRRKAMSLERYRAHSPTVETPGRHGQPLNVSMPYRWARLRWTSPFSRSARRST